MKKFRKYITAAGLILLAALIIAGTVSIATTSKYRTNITGYTDITPRTFRGGLVRDYTAAQLNKAYASDYDPTVNINVDDNGDVIPGSQVYYETFSTQLDRENLSPGMQTIEIPFKVTNGRSQNNHANVDIAYTIRIRTTNNLPLKYTLYKYDSNDNPVETFATGSEYYLEYPADKDAPKYIFTLHSVILDSQNQVINSNPDEVSFGMTGQRFTLDKYVLKIDWPVVDSDFYGRKSNSSIYMKEVDVVDVIVGLESTDREYTDSTHTVPGRDTSSGRFKSGGIIFVYPDAADYSYASGSDEVSVQEHSGDFRAFENTNLSGVSSMLQVWTVKLNNGYGVYTNGQILKADHPEPWSFSCVELTVPYDSDTKNLTYSIRVPDSLNLSTESDYLDLVPYEVEYRSYCVKYDSPDYGTYTVVNPLTIDDAFIANHGYGADGNEYGEYRLFANYKFKAPGLTTDYEYYFRLQNYRVENTGGEQVKVMVRGETTLRVVVREVVGGTSASVSAARLSELSAKDNPITLRVRTVWKTAYNYAGGVPADTTRLKVTS